ncbi:MAG: BamA/TamA family outer membrane protein [Calothrix sp. MO_167.B42]|nr:BamA/TamA family outer membrane protein [Calothrix sp. MO_167.B42]
MRLSPVLATVVAITAPLGTSLQVNAQTPTNNTKGVVIPKIKGKQQLNSGSSNPSAKTTIPEMVVPTITDNGLDTKVVPASVKSMSAVPQANSQSNSRSRESLIAALKASKKSPSQLLGSNLQLSLTDKGKNPNFPVNQLKSANNSTKNPTASVKLSPQTKVGLVVPLANSQGKIAQASQPPVPDIPPPGTQQQAPNQTPTNNQPTPEVQQTQPTPEIQQTQPTPETQQTQPTPEVQPEQTPPEQETRVLVSEVLVKSSTGELSSELEDQVYRAIRTKPGRTTTRSQLQEDINAIFATGFFSNVRAVPEDTPLGVRVSFEVQPNPVLTKVQIEANPGTNVDSVLKPEAADEVFRDQYGKILNLRDLQEGVKNLTKRYQDQGYVLAQVVGSPKVSEDGVVTLQVAEGVVEDIRVRFRNKEGQDTDDKGRPIKGRTQPYIIKREVELKSGQVFNRNKVQKDLQRIFGLGLFEDVNVSLDPGSDPSKVNVVLNVVERNSGSIAAGAGISSASGLFGTVSYQEQNLNGRNQKLGAEFQLGEREILFDARFTDPWIAGDPNRTSYTVNGFRRQSISLIFDGQDEDIETFDPDDPDDDGDRPRVVRTGGGVTFSRPLSGNPYERSEWVASAGVQYQRVTIQDADGNRRTQGRVEDTEDTNELLELSESGDGNDDLFLVKLGASRDRRNNPLQPTKGSFFRLGLDQSIPIGKGNIFMTRLRGSYSQYIPVDFTKFAKGAETLAFNVQGGTVIGDLPPYEAFTLGGSNSVRGYEEGGLSSGRSFVQASMEYRFPLFSVISGALFADFGSDLGTTTRAGELLNKNGTGFGYGLGVRVQSPLGPIRVDFGFNDDGDSRINFGIGERF